MANKPIFFDATGRRAARVSVVGWVAAVLSTILGIVFVATLFASPRMAQLRLPGQLTAINFTNLEPKAKAPALLRSAAKLAAEARAKRADLARNWRQKSARQFPATALRARTGRPLSIAFYPNWQSTSFPELKHVLPQLDWVIPTWLNLDEPNLNLKTVFDAHMLGYIRATKPNVAVLPTVQNASLGKWDGPGLAKLLSDAQRRHSLENQIAAFVAAHKLQGIVVDFEELPDNAHGDLQQFLHELQMQFAPRGWLIAMAAPFDDQKWPYAAYAKNIDYTILMAYDEHDQSDEPGSIAGQSWYETKLDARMKVLAPDRTIIGIGSYAYDWNGGPADAISFEDAMVAAQDAGAVIDFDDATNNPHFSYMEDGNIRHDIWFLDGATAFNEIHAADVYEPAGYALWRLGTEDPSIWNVMGRPYESPAPAGLLDIPISDDIDFEGQGEILRVDANPSTGTRHIELDPETGDIDDETYTRLPTTYVIRQFVNGPYDVTQHEIALTFDDGPDAQWTPQILDILKAKHVPATFFVIGGNAESNPEIVQRILAEGHELGNHTYTHPNLSDTPPQAVELELNATQRLVEALTGRSLRLFRPPYLGDAEPTDDDEIAPVELAQDMGYLTIGEHVDPVDWELPGVNAIVQRIVDQVHRGKPDMPANIVLLHDAGGDRSQTIAALPLMIDRLRAEGYRFVLVSDLAGLTRDQAMPRLASTLTLFMDRIVFLTLNALGKGLYVCFLAAIWLGILRLLLLAGLSAVNRWRNIGRETALPAVDQPFFVSVIVPAYNEERVIASTVQKILGSDYHNLNVIVIDDGSQDNTSGVVRAQFGNGPRVELVRTANSGKANALNTGVARAKGEIIVALDADTQFAPDTISRLVRWFADPKVGAVAGNAKVGNRVNMITRWQALEYIVAQNLERRALAALETLTVVPGAVGAWRRSALLEVGGYPTDTLAEDQDLTIHLQSKGYRVRFDSTAIAWTEAPNSFAGLARQRFRWAYGTLQCLWKYRRITFNSHYGALGLVALPQVWLFQIILTALAPLADLLLVWQLIGQGIAYLQHGAEFSNDNLAIIGIYYAVFVVVDLTAATIGFLMETNEDWSLLWWLMLQRFGYRQLMYYVVVRSIWTAIKGPFVGWGKLERTGMVNVGGT